MNSLHPDHLADLRKSRLTDEMIRLAGISSVRPQDIPSVLGQNPQKVTSAYKIPYPGTDFYRCKVFPPFQRDGHTVKYLQQPKTRPHLYIPPAVQGMLSNRGHPLAVVEGEKKTLRALQEGITAIGIGGIWSWRYEGKALPDFDPINWAARMVTVYPDSNTWVRLDLLQAVYALGRELEERGALVRIAVIDPGPNGETRGLDDLVAIQLKNGDLTGIEYLALKHKAFGRAAAWYRAWRMPEAAKPTFQHTWNPEPWPSPVDGRGLLEALTKIITSYLVVPRGADVAVALWIILTYATEAMDLLPILALISPTKRAGKTRFVEVIGLLCHRPIFASNVSPAALFRTIEEHQPTLLLDECDVTFEQNDELRQLMNAGHTRATAFVLRVVGDKHELGVFRTFGPKVVGLIGKLPPTLEDRSIVIPMRRKAAHEVVKRMRRQDRDCFEVARQHIARWMQDHKAALEGADPACPEPLDDRARDNWAPLLAIADLIGGDWPTRAREAALMLYDPDEASDGDGVRLLADVRAIFHEAGATAMASAALVEALLKREDSGWSEWRQGKPISMHGVASLLKPFGIRPRPMWGEKGTFRGYDAALFEDPFTRYLPSIEAQSVRTVRPPEISTTYAEISNCKEPDSLHLAKDG